MIKRITAGVLIAVSLFAVGCSMNNRETAPAKTIHKAGMNAENLSGMSYTNLEKKLGAPYKATYYINVDNLNTTRLKNLSASEMETLTMEDLRDSINVEASYKDPEAGENSYLHIYYENGIVKKAKVGEYTLNKDDSFVKSTSKEYKDIDFKVEFNNKKGLILNKDFSLDNAKKDLVGKNIKEFNKNYGLETSNFIVSSTNSNNTDQLYFYTLINSKPVNNDKSMNDNNYSSNQSYKNDTINPLNNNVNEYNKVASKDLIDLSGKSILVYTKDNVISAIDVIDGGFVYNLINKNMPNK